MVACEQCSTLNSLDSTFCKRCGATLNQEAIADAKVRLEDVIAQGNVALNADKVDEALAIADTAVATDPTSIAALALKSACHERRGEIPEALECAEKIVELNPDSDLDKIKRNQLRSALMSAATHAGAPSDKKAALVGAFATVVLVCCAGAFILIQRNKSPETVALKTEPLPTPQIQTPAPQPETAKTETKSTPQTNEVKPEASDAGAATRIQDQPVLPPARLELPGVPGTFPYRDTTRNNQAESNSDRDRQVDNSNRDEVKPKKHNDVDTEPGPEVTVTPPQKENTGTIEITTHTGSSRPVNGGSDNVESTAGGAAALTSTANQRYLVGNFSGAVDLFEKAIRAGGDATVLNQRLGQSYEKLGKRSEAVNAYTRAIRACEGAISSGRGNRSTLEARLEACRTAIKVINGG